MDGVAQKTNAVKSIRKKKKAVAKDDKEWKDYMGTDQSQAS